MEQALFPSGKKFISRLNDILSEIHQNLTGGKEQILITYEPNVSEEAFSEELKRRKRA